MGGCFSGRFRSFGSVLSLAGDVDMDLGLGLDSSDVDEKGADHGLSFATK